MKKIIDRKRYDTEKALKIHDYWNGYPTTDLQYVAETLYRSPSGAYFVAGRGGAMSRYCRSSGQHTWCGGEAIFPLTDAAEALDWLEKSGAPEDVIAQHFPCDIVDA